MKLGRLLQLALIAAVVLMMAASASASTITWNSNAAGTHFVGTGTLSMTSTDTLATLTFIPNASSTNTVPSNVDFGDFLLTCPSCVSSTFSAFTFNLVITDVTDGAVGTFIGTSGGGLVTPSSSTLNISWAPAQLGPGGLFLTTFFQVPNLTLIVAPNSGTPVGDTTIQGIVSATGAVPEPATMAMVGGLFVGLAALARKRRRS